MKVDELTENKTSTEVINIIDKIKAGKPETSSGEIINSEEDDGYEETDYYEEDDGYEEDDEDDDCDSVEKNRKILSKNKKKFNGEKKHGFNDQTVHLVSGQENLRGLLPAIEKPDEVADPTVKRCFTEHCYFAKILLNNEKPKTIGDENLKRPPDKADSATTNTLPFPNENASNGEQLTIDGESSRESEKWEVAKSATSRESLERPRATLKTAKKTWRLIKRDSPGNTDESELDDKIDGEYFPVEHTYESVENLNHESDTDRRRRDVKKNDGVDDVLVRIKKKQTKSSHKKKVKILKNVSGRFDENKKLIIFNRSGSVTSSGYLKTNKVPVKLANFDHIFSRLNKMQKFVNSKIGETTVTTATGNREKIPPPKLKRVTGSNRTKQQNFNRVPSTFLLVPNLTKMAGTTPTPTTATPGNKNWRVRYMENDVQSLGLDDLLLKASELNAENFTKALGRKLETVKPSNFNGKESSEIVLTIPKFKGHSTEVKQYVENFEKDSSAESPVKSMKMDFFTDPYSSGEKEVNEGDTKKPETEISPKKAGIKVKTVENINEEFKDSLETKKKESKDSSSLEKTTTGTTEGNRVDKAGGKSANPPTDELSARRGERSKLSSKDSQSLGVDGEDNGRPFIMTIVQEKPEKQRPAILRNSACFKKKTGNSDGEKEKYEKEDDKEFNARSPGEFLRIDKNDEKESANGKTEAKKGSVTIDKDAGEESGQSKYSSKKKSISFILNHGRKGKQVDSTQGNNTKSGSVQGTKLVKGNGQIPDLPGQNEKSSRLTSGGQKPGSKEETKRFAKVIPYEPATREPKTQGDSVGQQPKNSDQDLLPEKTSHKDSKSQHLLSLSAFSSVLKEILPDKWFLCLDKRYGLQIMKTHVDETLNPCVLMSVVIARCGKVTVNVRGKQLDKCHQLFANLCDIKNPDSKLSLNYILAILNKLRYLSVCHGSYPALKKYSPEDKSTAGTGNQQAQHDYRSPFCPLLVSLGKKRCYPCYRMKESLKKRHRRSKTEDKTKEADQEGGEGAVKESSLSASPNEEPETETVANKGSTTTTPTPAAASARGVKRNLEDFLEESFSTMKQQIEDELEKNKKFGEMEKALKAQEEVLSFMGLTRKDNLDGNPVRKSRRTRSSFYKNQSQQASHPDMNKIDQKELQFLETYWSDINTLFSTSLLFGAYSRTGRSRLREKCRMFYKLLSTWREIVRTNPDWIGGEIVSIPDEDSSDQGGADRFDKMDVAALRAYIINSVKEVNRIKHKLRTRNSYFKLLYNKFVKRRMRRSKSELGGTGGRTEDYEEKKETPSSANSAMNTPTDLSSDESSREKEKTSPATNPTTDDGKRSTEENNPDGDKTPPDSAVPETTNSPVEPIVCPPTEPVPSPDPPKQD